ncbi:hepatocyte growth factor-regulated tyrosine kinase substrate isoform X2 [Pieris brassicae]|uniref:hepatocyte growth factor-regulated tyrosine kinase substrate isoform X2 n=1 Tax=Pieris brassicae TaxID=7116 RepID=UPI001E65EAB3|nr:hepatocyte growth factor-regulated tyrosine kinase substrate isoform X2 [Pieris brassicae]
MFRATMFDKLLDKATSNLRLDPDWPSILQICDLIRQNDCSPKYAVAAVKKKLYSQNPHQAMFALLTLESIVKNCGSGVHDEVTSKVFCEMLRDLVKTTQHENLKNKILELIQAWAFAFRNSPKYRAVQDTVNILKAEGHKFPPLKESDAMFSADTAPEWADGEVCHRCRVAFSLMVRRHHCRACGQVFCQQCSSKTSTLPKFGIEKEVRVCDACFDKVSRPPSSTAKIEINDPSSDYGPAPAPKKPGKSAEELQEEEELQLALALSQSEAEQKEKEKERRSRTFIAPEPTSHPTLSPSPSSVSPSPEHSTTGNSELSRYLDRNYWEQRLSSTAAPTAPSSHGTNDNIDDFVKPSTVKTQDDEPEDKEIDEFVENLKSQVEIFVNRMKSNSSRGRSIANDSSVQTLFMNITTMHSKLLKYIQQQDDKRVYLESLQDKISQVRDSRAALDTLRAEHAARLAQAAEAAERQRQMQMAAKLQAMRKKKHEYLQYQRQLALQRVQEQEREMQMRQEQQKHQYRMSSSGFYMPGMSMHQFQPGFPNQMMYNPQFHPQMAQSDNSNLPGQPQMSQPNMPMNVGQMGTISQSMPQMNNTFTMSTSAATLTQVPPVQVPMTQPNMRPMGQQHPMQQQMMMQQMQQMRPQPGMHQMMPNIPPGQTQPNLPNQMPKNIPNQSQPPNTMMPPMTMPQPNMPHQSNANMYGMQINMRMPHTQGNQLNNNPSIPVSAYPVNAQNPQVSTTMPNMPQGAQMPGQASLPGHGQAMMPGQNIPMQNQIPLNQNMPQLPPNQGQIQQPQLSQSQPMPGQPHFQNPHLIQPPNMSQQNPQINPGAPIVQNNMPNQSVQQINPNNMVPSSVPQHLHPSQSMQQGQPMGSQNQQLPQNMQPPNLPHNMQPPSNMQLQHMHQQPTNMPPQNMHQQPPNMPLQNMQQQPQNMQQQPPNMASQSMQQQPQNMQQQQPSNMGPQNMQQPLSMQQIPNMPHQNLQQPPNMQQHANMPQQNLQQPMKMQQNFGNNPQNPQPVANQSQQVQTLINKSESNNNTAELISFD